MVKPLNCLADASTRTAFVCPSLTDCTHSPYSPSCVPIAKPKSLGFDEQYVKKIWCKESCLFGINFSSKTSLPDLVVTVIFLKVKSLYVTNQLSFAVVSQTISSLIYFF